MSLLHNNPLLPDHPPTLQATAHKVHAALRTARCQPCPPHDVFAGDGDNWLAPPRGGGSRISLEGGERGGSWETDICDRTHVRSQLTVFFFSLYREAKTFFTPCVYSKCTEFYGKPVYACKA